MKTLSIYTFVFLTLMSVIANDELYEASKTMIVDTTEMRLNAIANNDFDKVCNAIGSRAGIDTMVYYLAFEILENEEYAKQLSDEVGYFYYRNLESLYKAGLPMELHGACARNNELEIRDIMDSISSILAQE